MNSFKSQIINTDIYLVDQILKGNFDDFKTVLDVGCGGGRNLPYFLQNNFEVFGIDPNESRIITAKKLSNANAANFKVAVAEDIPFSLNFDLIICNAVLHFAKDENNFETMLNSMWEKLNKGGILFIRLASDIGIEEKVKLNGDGNYNLPDGSVRYLVNQEILLDYTIKFGAELVENIKTTNVQNLRCMTTWILRKM